MNTSNVKLRWVFAAALAAFPVVGLICSFVYHDISMLWVSLIFAAGAAVVFPVVFVLVALVQKVLSTGIAATLIFISEILRFRKR